MDNQGQAATEATRKVMTDMYDAYRRGDLGVLESVLAEDVDWSIEISADYFPFAGARRGRVAVVAALRELGERLEMLKYETWFVVVEDERACFVNRCHVRDRTTGHATEVDLCDIVRVEDGKIVWFREIFDTLTATEGTMGTKARFG